MCYAAWGVCSVLLFSLVGDQGPGSILERKVVFDSGAECCDSVCKGELCVLNWEVL